MQGLCCPGDQPEPSGGECLWGGGAGEVWQQPGGSSAHTDHILSQAPGF